MVKPSEEKNKMSFIDRQKEKHQAFKKNRALKKRQKARKKAEENYEKELNEKGRTTKSRTKEHSTYHLWGKRLIIANIVVFLLLVALVIMVFLV